MKTQFVPGAGGVSIYTQEHGSPNKPAVLLIHGWSQSSWAWAGQYFDPNLASSLRMVGLDLRGHGLSDAPLSKDAYHNSDNWADDVNAVISSLNLKNPVLVGWSYGGLVIGDYLRKYGDDNIGAVNLVGAAVRAQSDAVGTLVGETFIQKTLEASNGENLLASTQALREIMAMNVTKPVTQDESEIAVGLACKVDPRVRGWLITRLLDLVPAYAKLSKPLLATHGRLDEVVLPAMAELVVKSAPNASISWYDKSAHAPFFDDPNRFNNELLKLAQNAAA